MARIRRQKNPCAMLVGMQTGAATVENRIKLPQKIKNGTALWPSDSTCVKISKETQNTNLTEHMHPYVHYSIICNSQSLEVLQVPSTWVYKKAVVHLHNGILLNCKKRRNLTLCNSMDGPGECYAKWNKPVRERQVPYDFTYMWNLMNKIN